MSQRFFRYSSEGKIIKICQTQTKRTSSCHRKKYILVPRCILSLAFSLTPTQIINLKPDISNVSYRRTVEDWTQYFSGAVCRGHEASYYLVSFLPFFFFCFWHRGFFFPFFFSVFLLAKTSSIVSARLSVSHLPFTSVWEGLFSGAEAGRFYSCSVPVSHWLDK